MAFSEIPWPCCHSRDGRPGGIRTPSIRFWRPALYQLELLACTFYTENMLFSFPVKYMRPAKRAIFFQFHSAGGLFFIFSGGVIPALAFRTSQMHNISHLLPLSYSITSETTPAPTVRPPSRMANLTSFSIAIGVIRLPVTDTLSPGITISTPSGRSTTPVTSVVRK